MSLEALRAASDAARAEGDIATNSLNAGDKVQRANSEIANRRQTDQNRTIGRMEQLGDKMRELTAEMVEMQSRKSRKEGLRFSAGVQTLAAGGLELFANPGNDTMLADIETMKKGDKTIADAGNMLKALVGNDKDALKAIFGSEDPTSFDPFALGLIQEGEGAGNSSQDDLAAAGITDSQLSTGLQGLTQNAKRFDVNMDKLKELLGKNGVNADPIKLQEIAEKLKMGAKEQAVGRSALEGQALKGEIATLESQNNPANAAKVNELRDRLGKVDQNYTDAKYGSTLNMISGKANKLLGAMSMPFQKMMDYDEQVKELEEKIRRLMQEMAKVQSEMEVNANALGQMSGTRSAAAPPMG